MSQTNVASCVMSIIASFSSGLDVFRKLRDARTAPKRRITKSTRPLTEAEVALAKSLRLGPEDIGREYQRSILAVGDQFAVGDAIAQTSLAEILLKLNTGLVSIINTFLSRDKTDAKLDYHSLTALSERCRIDTCRTLRQLYRRMFQMRAHLPPATPDRRVHEATQSSSVITDATKSKKRTVPAKHTKSRAPMLARVVVENSSKPSQIALVKSGERRKKPGRSTASPNMAFTSSPSLVKEIPPVQETGSPVECPRPSQRPRPERPRTRRTNSSADVPPLDPLACPELRRGTQSTSRLESLLPSERAELPSPPLPTPLPRPGLPRRRKPTPTYYSIASGSTRLGEIPMHRWAEPYDFDAMSILNREAARNGWPAAGDLGADSEGAAATADRKKRGGIFRLFRKRTT